MVKAYVACGTPQDDIAEILGIDPKTLRKHYAREIRLGTAEANANVAGKLYQSAMDGNVVAQIFWLKTRAGYREARHDDHPAASGGSQPREIALIGVAPSPISIED